MNGSERSRWHTSSPCRRAGIVDLNRRRHGFSRCAGAPTGCSSCSIFQWSASQARVSPIAAGIPTFSQSFSRGSRAQTHWLSLAGNSLNHSVFMTSGGQQTLAGTATAGATCKCTHGIWQRSASFFYSAGAGAAARFCPKHGFATQRGPTWTAPLTATTTVTRGGSKETIIPGCLKRLGVADSGSTSGRRRISWWCSPAVNSNPATSPDSYSRRSNPRNLQIRTFRLDSKSESQKPQSLQRHNQWPDCRPSRPASRDGFNLSTNTLGIRALTLDFKNDTE